MITAFQLSQVMSSKEIINKLEKKPGIKKVKIFNGQLQITYDPTVVSLLQIYRWVQEAKAFTGKG